MREIDYPFQRAFLPLAENVAIMESVVRMLAPVTIALLLFVLARLVFALWVRVRGAYPNYPPGPKSLPVLGNVHQLPGEYQEKAFGEWTKQYGTCRAVDPCEGGVLSWRRSLQVMLCSPSSSGGRCSSWARCVRRRTCS